MFRVMSLFVVFVGFGKLRIPFYDLGLLFHIFSAANLDFPSFCAGARAWARGLRRRMENVFFFKWVVEPLPRLATVSTPPTHFQTLQYRKVSSLANGEPLYPHL